MSKKAIGLSEEGILIAEWVDEQTAPAEGDHVSLGKCYRDSATLEDGDGEEILCECEEIDEPEDMAYMPGKTTLKYSTTDLDPDSCAKIYGGTVETVADKKVWKRPSSLGAKLVSVKFRTKSGLGVEFAKMRMYSKFNWGIKKDGYGQIDHSLTAVSEMAIDQ